MEIQLVVISFIAGILTILAPCILPLIPILIGTSLDNKTNKNRAFTVIASLLLSIIVLTLLIYGTSNILRVNQSSLRIFSSGIIILIGVFMLFPKLWEWISAKTGLNTSSNKLLGKAMKHDGRSRDVLIGVALGPVFSSCSPTYGLIIATILPQNLVTGTIYLFWYVLGLGLMFVLIVLLGRKFTAKLSWATNPEGWFKRAIGALFLIIGIAIVFNFDKSFESWLLQLEFYDSLVNFELDLNN